MSFMLASAVLAQTGQEFTSQDWSDRVGVLIGAIVVVLIVNGIGLYFIRRSDSELQLSDLPTDERLDLRSDEVDVTEAQT